MEFIATLIILSVICSAILMIAPDGGFGKYIALACSLCVIAVTGAGLAKLSGGGISFELPKTEITDRTDEMRRIVIEQTVNNIESSVRSAAFDKYNIESKDIDVTVIYEDTDGNVTVTGIVIKVRGLENAVKLVALEVFIADSFGCVCEAEFIE